MHPYYGDSFLLARKKIELHPSLLDEMRRSIPDRAKLPVIKTHSKVQLDIRRSTLEEE
jgi:hypothetical protein